jgi:hypothetical protein
MVLMAQWDGGGSRSRRRRDAIVAVSVLLVAGVVLARPYGAIDPGVDPDTLEIERDAEPAERTDELPGGTGWIGAAPLGGWTPLPRAPVPARRDHVAVWTGEALLVWGGRDEEGWRPDGGVYDPATDRWTRIAQAPFLPYAGTLAAWDGHRLVVIGAAGGASGAYAPASDSWEAFPEPPGEAGWTAMAVLDGDVVLAGRAGGVTVAATHDREGGSWRSLPAPPLEDGVYAMEAVAGRLALLGPGTGEQLATTAYDPGIGGWSAPQQVPAGVDWTPSLAVDDRGNRLVLGGPSHARSATHAVRAWQVGGEEGEDWTNLPDLPRGLSRASPELLAVDGGVLAWAADDPGAAAWLGSDAEFWRPLATPPDDVGVGAAAVWSGEALLVWGGEGAGGGAWTREHGGVELPPADAPRYEGRWAGHGAPPDERQDPALVWTGVEVLVWGGHGSEGEPFASDGLRWDPRTGAWGSIPDGPLPGRSEPVVGWTGRELVVVGGRTGGGWSRSGAAFDPQDGNWRVLPDAPTPAGAQPVGAIVDGALYVAAGDPVRIAVYEPARDGWRVLSASPTPDGAPLGLVDVDGRALLVTERATWLLATDGRSWEPAGAHALAGRTLLTAMGAPSVAALDGRQLARYDVERRRWVGTARPFAHPPAGQPVWTGTHLVVWGAALVGDHGRGRRGAAVYDPAADRWHVLPDPPPGASPAGPAVWTGEEVVFWSPWELVTFRPEEP